ncbi:aspartyl protease family protein [Chitinophagaceae bacterium 26-R-25]|nr:aspartyl protease family protein [Chitinophagaceae bacterium 26-R-25]
MRRNNFSVTIVLLALLLSVSLAKGQEILQAPAKLLTSFPIKQYNGGVIIVYARLDDIPDTLHFILDTGSSGISLDSTTVAKYKIASEASNKTVRGIAGIKPVRFANNHSLKLPGLSVDSLNFHINDYDILTSVYGETIDGIIGFSFFNRYIIKIDYDSLIMHVYSKGFLKYPRGGHLLKPGILNIPIQEGSVEEQRNLNARFYFDSGAGLCLLFSEDFADDSLKFSVKKKIVETEAEGLGGKTKMRLTTLKSFKLGPYKFRKVPAYIFEDDYNVTSYPYLGGLIGNDLLRRFNVILNYEKREIYLMPNSHFREPFDYAYSGLSIYYIEGQVVITDIMKGSPAAAAGFREGDVIVAINENTSRNVQIYKGLLQAPNQRVRLIIARENEGLKEITFKVSSIR